MNFLRQSRVQCDLMSDERVSVYFKFHLTIIEF